MATINDPKIRKILNASLTQDAGLSDIQKRMSNIVDFGIGTDEDVVNPKPVIPKSATSIPLEFQPLQMMMRNTKPKQVFDKTDVINSLMPKGSIKLDPMKMRNIETIAKIIKEQEGVSSPDEHDLFDKILGYNKGLGTRTDMLHGARTATNLGVLLNNILQPDGDTLPSQVNLTRPDIQYDDTIRRKMVTEAGQQSNIAQMNAMKLGMREAIPAISSNMMRATNDVNTQAQSNINEIQQKNAMLASEIANKEIEANLTLSEKRIQEAMMKNELRNRAISGQIDTTFRDLGKWQQQREAINQENMLTDIFRNMPADTSSKTMAYLNQLIPGLKWGDDDSKGTRKGQRKIYDEFGNPLN